MHAYYLQRCINVSSAEEAISVMKLWWSKSSRLRIVLATPHARMALNGFVFRIEDLSIVCTGSNTENELRFDLSGARSVAFADQLGIAEGFEFSKARVVDDLVAIIFEDGTRLLLVNETSH